MKKQRHSWQIKTLNKLNRKTQCINCGIFKEMLLMKQGYLYYFDSKEMIFINKTPGCLKK